MSAEEILKVLEYLDYMGFGRYKVSVILCGLRKRFENDES